MRPSVLWVVQSRSKFRFGLWLKNPPVRRRWATWNLAFISVLCTPSRCVFLQPSRSVLTCLFSSPRLSSASPVCSRAARPPSWEASPCRRAADTCWVSPRRQKVRSRWAPIASAGAPLTWLTGNELNPARRHLLSQKRAAVHSRPGRTCAWGPVRAGTAHYSTRKHARRADSVQTPAGPGLVSQRLKVGNVRPCLV